MGLFVGFFQKLNETYNNSVLYSTNENILFLIVLLICLIFFYKCLIFSIVKLEDGGLVTQGGSLFWTSFETSSRNHPIYSYRRRRNGRFIVPSPTHRYTLSFQNPDQTKNGVLLPCLIWNWLFLTWLSWFQKYRRGLVSNELQLLFPTDDTLRTSIAINLAGVAMSYIP